MMSSSWQTIFNMRGYWFGKLGILVLVFVDTIGGHVNHTTLNVSHQRHGSSVPCGFSNKT